MTRGSHLRLMLGRTEKTAIVDLSVTVVVFAIKTAFGLGSLLSLAGPPYAMDAPLLTSLALPYILCSGSSCITVLGKVVDLSIAVVVFAITQFRLRTDLSLTGTPTSRLTSPGACLAGGCALKNLTLGAAAFAPCITGALLACGTLFFFVLVGATVWEFDPRAPAEVGETTQSLTAIFVLEAGQALHRGDLDTGAV